MVASMKGQYNLWEKDNFQKNSDKKTTEEATNYSSPSYCIQYTFCGIDYGNVPKLQIVQNRLRRLQLDRKGYCKVSTATAVLIVFIRRVQQIQTLTRSQAEFLSVEFCESFSQIRSLGIKKIFRYQFRIPDKQGSWMYTLGLVKFSNLQSEKQKQIF